MNRRNAKRNLVLWEITCTNSGRFCFVSSKENKNKNKKGKIKKQKFVTRNLIRGLKEERSGNEKPHARIKGNGFLGSHAKRREALVSMRKIKRKKNRKKKLRRRKKGCE